MDKKVTNAIRKLKWVILAVIVLAVAAAFIIPRMTDKGQKGQLDPSDFRGKYDIIINLPYELETFWQKDRIGNNKRLDHRSPAHDVIKVTDEEAKKEIVALLEKITFSEELGASYLPMGFPTARFTSYKICANGYLYTVARFAHSDETGAVRFDYQEKGKEIFEILKWKIVDKELAANRDGQTLEKLRGMSDIYHDPSILIPVFEKKDEYGYFKSVISREDYEKLEALSTGLAEDQYTVVKHYDAYDPAEK